MPSSPAKKCLLILLGQPGRPGPPRAGHQPPLQREAIPNPERLAAFFLDKPDLPRRPC